jgi:hypothetical protein
MEKNEGWVSRQKTTNWVLRRPREPRLRCKRRFDPHLGAQRDLSRQALARSPREYAGEGTMEICRNITERGLVCFWRVGHGAAHLRRKRGVDTHLRA